MDRDTTLKWAPIFRKVSIILILITFATWALPYFNYDADTWGIDTSKGPLRFVPQNVPLYTEVSNPTYGTYASEKVVDLNTNEFKVTLRFKAGDLFEPYTLGTGENYADYLNQFVFDRANMRFNTPLDAEGNERTIGFSFNAADVPDASTEMGAGYAEYIKQYVFGTSLKVEKYNFNTSDIPEFNDELGMTLEQYEATYIYDPATGSIDPETGELDLSTVEFKIPVRFSPTGDENFPFYDGQIGMTYEKYLQDYIFDFNTGEYKTDIKITGSLYRGNDTLKTRDGKNEVHDYPDKYTLWEFVLKAYDYPQILAQINYKSAEPMDAKQHARFYDTSGSIKPWRQIKIGTIPHDEINTNPRFIKMWFIAPTLYQIFFGAIALFMCWKKRGIMTQFFPLVFGIIGIFGYAFNRVLNYNTNPVSYWIQLAMCVLVLINGIIGFVIQWLEIKSRPSEYYLPMI